MSINTPSPEPVDVQKPRGFDPKKAAIVALIAGVVGLFIAVIGFLVDTPHRVGMSGLIALNFWLSIVLGMLFMVMLHHIFDAGWSTVIRRPLEHCLAALPWLGLLFVPLVLLSLYYDGGGFIWRWMAPDDPYVGGDVLYHHKSPYLNNPFFVIRFIFYFAVWIGLAWAFRHASFSQDRDGDPKWTTMNRRFAAAGLILGALTVSFAAMDWIKSLDYHWFSTMFGVWYFSGGMRGAFAVTVIMCVALVKFGPFEGIFKQTHLYEIGRMMLAFTIFWAYIAYSQYFLILNANIPEETFFYVVRELGNWWNVGLALVFGAFFLPFVYLLFYGNKTSSVRMIVISVWILAFHLLDMYYNILPSRLDNWSPVYNFPIFDVALLWDAAALVGVGGICVWAALRSFSTQRIIPVRDPRILESVDHHG